MGTTMNRHLLAIASALAFTAVAGTAVAAGPNDPFTGAWLLNDGDGSSSRYLLGAPGADATRQFSFFDTYATFCEVDGPGTGSSLVASGTAIAEGVKLNITITSFHCAN